MCHYQVLLGVSRNKTQVEPGPCVTSAQISWEPHGNERLCLLDEDRGQGAVLSMSYHGASGSGNLWQLATMQCWLDCGQAHIFVISFILLRVIFMVTGIPFFPLVSGQMIMRWRTWMQSSS
jgi:hypothetical protein